VLAASPVGDEKAGPYGSAFFIIFPPWRINVRNRTA